MDSRRSTFATIASLATVFALGLPSPAFATPKPPAPSNDQVGGAIAITALPYDKTEDTTAATTDSDDAALNANCGAPATNGSVWFSWTAPAGVDGLVVDVSQSTYSAGVIIAERNAGTLSLDTCGPGTVGLPVTAGTTYYILAFGDTVGAPTGTLQLHAEAAVIPTVAVTVNRRGKVDHAGDAILTGTYTCSNGSFVDISTQLNQPVGRVTIQGFGDAFSATCDGATHAWTAVITPNNGKFAGGKAAGFTDGFSCGNLFCNDSFVQQQIQLSK